MSVWLSLREQDVILALVECPEGGIAGVAERLSLSLSTVNLYLYSARKKTGTQSSVQLVLWALREAQRMARMRDRLSAHHCPFCGSALAVDCRTAEMLGD